MRSFPCPCSHVFFPRVRAASPDSVCFLCFFGLPPCRCCCASRPLCGLLLLDISRPSSLHAANTVLVARRLDSVAACCYRSVFAIMHTLGQCLGRAREKEGGGSCAGVSLTFTAFLRGVSACVLSRNSNELLPFFTSRAPRCSLTWPSPLLRPSGCSVHRVRGPGNPLSIRRATVVGERMRFEDGSILASLSLPLTLPLLRHSLLLCLLHWPGPNPSVSSALAVPDLGILCDLSPAILAAQRIVSIAGIGHRRLPPLAPLASCICSAPDVPDLGIL